MKLNFIEHFTGVNNVMKILWIYHLSRNVNVEIVSFPFKSFNIYWIINYFLRMINLPHYDAVYFLIFIFYLIFNDAYWALLRSITLQTFLSIYFIYSLSL